jgi:hypothetical protein
MKRENKVDLKIWPVDLHTYSYFVNLKRRVKVFLKVLRTFITSIVRYGQTQYSTYVIAVVL